MAHRLHKILRTLIITSTLFFTTIFLLIAYFFFGFHSSAKKIEPRLAFWMSHSWSQGTSENYFELSKKVKELKITDLYFHVGPIEADGTLAKDLNIFSPGLDTLSSTNYAWIGQIRSKIDLDNPDIRKKIINSSEWLLRQGFDGIHIDIEPVKDEDENFFKLLEEFRTALPDTKISVAADEWQPDFLSLAVSKMFGAKIESYWTSEQIIRTMEYADQLVLMTYDTGFKDPKLYSWWVEQETLSVSKLIPDGKEFFVGIPSYDEGSNFNPEAENLKTGLKGFLKGIQNYRSKLDNISGLAIYTYWHMSEDEFNILKNYETNF